MRFFLGAIFGFWLAFSVVVIEDVRSKPVSHVSIITVTGYSDVIAKGIHERRIFVLDPHSRKRYALPEDISISTKELSSDRLY